MVMGFRGFFKGFTNSMSEKSIIEQLKDKELPINVSNGLRDSKKINELTKELEELKKKNEFLTDQLNKYIKVKVFTNTPRDFFEEKQINNEKLPIRKFIRKINFEPLYREMEQIGYINSKKADEMFHGSSGIAIKHIKKGLKFLKRGKFYFFKQEDIEKYLNKHYR
jgi:hypothetical protein